MKNRSEVLTIYRDFAKMIQTQYSKTIKVFRSDNAREYRQTDFSSILKHYGTIFHTSCAGTSQQNKQAELFFILCHQCNLHSYLILG